MFVKWCLNESYSVSYILDQNTLIRDKIYPIIIT